MEIEEASDPAGSPSKDRLMDGWPPPAAPPPDPAIEDSVLGIFKFLPFPALPALPPPLLSELMIDFLATVEATFETTELSWLKRVWVQVRLLSCKIWWLM